MRANAGATTGTMDIRRLISGMANQVAAAKAQQQAALDAEQAAREKTEAYWQNVDRKAENRLARNLAAATAGLHRITEFAKSLEIQQIIRLDGELFRNHCGNRLFSRHSDGEGEFMFFYVDYVAPGESDFSEMADRHGGIFLKPDTVLVVAHDYDGHDVIEVALHERNFLEAVCDLLDGDDEEETGLEEPEEQPLGIGDALRRDFKSETRTPFIDADTLSRSRGLNPLAMWEGGWCDTPFTYAELFGRVFIDCADEKKFERYCAAALARLARK